MYAPRDDSDEIRVFLSHGRPTPGRRRDALLIEVGFSRRAACDRDLWASLHRSEVPSAANIMSIHG
jgi:hypothetical protein